MEVLQIEEIDQPVLNHLGQRAGPVGIEGPRSTRSTSGCPVSLSFFKGQLGQQPVQFIQGVTEVRVKLQQASTLPARVIDVD